MSKDADYIKGIDGAERRHFTAELRMVKRDDGSDAAVIEGYAAKYNVVTTIGSWFREVILPGFFDDVMEDDVRCLFNHDPNYPLARCKQGKGTLSLSLDNIGLKYEYITPDRQYARDLANSIEMGDVSESSFAFKPKETRWVEKEGELELRELVKCERLFDVSPVTYPAYEDTTVAKRSFDAHLAEKQKETDQGSDKNKVLTRNAAQVLINQNL